MRCEKHGCSNDATVEGRVCNTCFVKEAREKFVVGSVWECANPAWCFQILEHDWDGTHPNTCTKYPAPIRAKVVKGTHSVGTMHYNFNWDGTRDCAEQVLTRRVDQVKGITEQAKVVQSKCKRCKDWEVQTADGHCNVCFQLNKSDAYNRKMLDTAGPDGGPKLKPVVADVKPDLRTSQERAVDAAPKCDRCGTLHPTCHTHPYQFCRACNVKLDAVLKNFVDSGPGPRYY